MTTQILLFAGYGDKGDWDSIMSGLRKIKNAKVNAVAIPWEEKIDIEEFVSKLPKSKCIIIAHSIGFIFAYYLAKLRPKKVKLIISIDGSYIGPAAVAARKLITSELPPMLLNLIKQIPETIIEMPVRTICLRRLRIEDGVLKKYIPEDNMYDSIRYYIGNHALHKDPVIAQDIIDLVKMKLVKYR